MAVDISVVICSRNMKQHLARTLESLRKLEVPDGLAHEVLLQKEIEHLPPWADPENLLFCTCYDPSPAPG